MDLDIRQYLSKAKEQQGLLCNNSGVITAVRVVKVSYRHFIYVDSGALQSAYHLITDMAAAGTSGRTPGIAPELYVACAEAALQVRLLGRGGSSPYCQQGRTQDF